jgi:DNA-binding MarR family transcriptional regulator
MATKGTPAKDSMAHRLNNQGAKASDSILYQVSHTYHELTAAFERHMGMSRPRWAILSRLSAEECLTQTTLAQLLHVDAAVITRQVKQLEAEGMVTRWAPPEDKRFTVVALTPRGKEFVVAQRGLRDEFERVVTSGLSAEEIDNMRQSLMHMRRNLELLSDER